MGKKLFLKKETKNSTNEYWIDDTDYTIYFVDRKPTEKDKEWSEMAEKLRNIHLPYGVVVAIFGFIAKNFIPENPSFNLRVVIMFLVFLILFPISIFIHQYTKKYQAIFNKTRVFTKIEDDAEFVKSIVKFFVFVELFIIVITLFVILFALIYLNTAGSFALMEYTLSILAFVLLLSSIKNIFTSSFAIYKKAWKLWKAGEKQ